MSAPEIRAEAPRSVAGPVPIAPGPAGEGALGAVSGPAAAPLTRRVGAQAAFDVRSMLSNGEQLLLTIILPMLVLIGLAKSSVVELGSGSRVDLATAGVLALALISTSFTGQAIGTGFDRRAGLLRLLGTTPLGRGGLVAGRVVAILLVEVIQVCLLGAVALALGWRPAAAGILPAVIAGILGTAAFTALGLLLAGTLRAEAVLAAANLVWVLLLAGGGVVLAAHRMGAASDVISLLPSSALGDAMRAALAHGAWPWSDLAILLAWAVAAIAGVVRWFRWT